MFRQVTFIFVLLFALASGSQADSVPKPSCLTMLCPFRTKCVDSPTGSKCVPIDPNCSLICKFGFICANTPKGEQCIGDCSITLCTPGTVCTGSPEGVTCDKPKPTCKTIRCASGFRCVDTPNGGKCEPCICTADYNPVCCQFSDGKKKTVSNSCRCTGCGALNKILHKGACRPSCICPKILRPVCCKTKKGIIRTSNSCRCKCRGGSVVPGKCRSPRIEKI